jgi:sugar phosphate isomerase/epimerase
MRGIMTLSTAVRSWKHPGFNGELSPQEEIMRYSMSLLALSCVLSVPMLGIGMTAKADSVPYPKLNYAAMNKLGWKLCSQAWTFRDRSLMETIDTLKDLGIKYIEIYPGQRFSPSDSRGFDHNSPQDMIDAFKAKLKEDGITAVNYGVVGLDNNEANDRKVFDFAKKLGLETIVSEPSSDSYDLVDKLCNEYKINVAMHDHPKPDYYWNPDVILAACKGHSKRLGACADTGHWYRSGLNPLDCLKELKGHIISLHFKDLNADKMDVPWGTGVCDAKGMLQEMKNQHFKGVFSIEYETGSGPELVDNVAKCCQFFSNECTLLAK